MAQLTSLHGIPCQGPTAGRPGNAYPGCLYFDTDLDCLIVFDGAQWEATVQPLADDFASPSLADVVPGTLVNDSNADAAGYYDGTDYQTFAAS